MEGDFILKLVKSLFGFSSGVHADMIVSRIWGNDALKIASYSSAVIEPHKGSAGPTRLL